jgi:hypothetical protein
MPRRLHIHLRSSLQTLNPDLSSAARPRSASRSAACASMVTRSISSLSRATLAIASRSPSHLSASSCRSQQQARLDYFLSSVWLFLVSMPSMQASTVS